MFKKEETPAELIAKCTDLTKNWLASQQCEAVPYLQHCEIDDEWRIAIWHAPLNQPGKVLLCNYLQPTVDGHTLYLLVNACFDAEARGKENGKTEALLKLFQQQCETVGIGSNSTLTIGLTREVNGASMTASITKK